MRLCDLRQKEVINICTCSSLGCVMDVDIDEHTGQILALIVPGPCKFPPIFARENEIIIPWRCICQIGEEIILVEAKDFPPK